MGLGPDIKKVYQEIGSGITIIRDLLLISGEYIDQEINAQATKSFIKSFFRSACLAYDTSGEAGDIIRLDTTSEVFIIVHFAPELFNNEVYDYDTVLYKCNVLSGELLRPSGEVRDPQTYHIETQWELIRGECYALQTENIFGIDIETDAELGEIGIENHELYIPESYGAKINDRFITASGEYYKINAIKTRRFPGVVICKLEEDTR